VKTVDITTASDVESAIGAVVQNMLRTVLRLKDKRHQTMSLRHKELKRADIATLITGIVFGIVALMLSFTDLCDTWIALVFAVATICAFWFWLGIDYADKAISRKAKDAYIATLDKITRED